MRDVTIPLNALTAFIAFLLTHPVWDVTLMLFYLFHAFCNISTHTSRVGCDLLIYFFELVSNISTHTSRVGCDARAADGSMRDAFLLTHPVWDVTIWMKLRSVTDQFLLTHPVWDVIYRSRYIRCRTIISTHTSRVGCDAIYSILQSQHPHISRDGLIIHLELY